MTLISSKVLEHVISREKTNNGSLFTVKSLKTGTDYTYKISRKEYKSKWYTHVKVETQYLSFKYLGSYFKGKLFKKGEVVKSPTAVAIGFILDQVEKHHFEWLDKNLELSHEGHCLCCGKTLTDADSIKRGLGPVCAGTH
jgi:hypothetical protein